jgi:hypothetical protein
MSHGLSSSSCSGSPLEARRLMPDHLLAYGFIAGESWSGSRSFAGSFGEPA